MGEVVFDYVYHAITKPPDLFGRPLPIVSMLLAGAALASIGHGFALPRFFAFRSPVAFRLFFDASAQMRVDVYNGCESMLNSNRISRNIHGEIVNAQRLCRI
jgi:hypothetical protein